MDEFAHDVVAAVLVRDGRALLCHRDPTREWFPDVWDVPGGHVDVGESPTHALARELREELGVEIARLSAEPFATFHEGTDLRIRVWVIDQWRGQVSNGAPDEHDDIAWYSPSEIDSLDLADPRLADLVRTAIGHAGDTATTDVVRRHLTIVLSESEVGDAAGLRRRWDPVMAAGVPPHITVVYPEETEDLAELVERARRVIPGSGQFEVSLGESTAIDAGEGGVFLEVHDHTGSIGGLRQQVIRSPAERSGLGAHLTIAHPRTCLDGPACWDDLRGWSADVRLRIRTVAFTETSLRSGMRIVETYQL